MKTMKLVMAASALVALVGCSGTGTNNAAGASTGVTSSQNTTQPQSPAAEYRPYVCDQGGDHNC
jgi:hypothetical protein